MSENNTEVGEYNAYAALWSGSAASRVDLHPPGGTYAVSRAYAVAANQQVGFAEFSFGHNHAMVWSGTAASFVDLHPAGPDWSEAKATDGVSQGGEVFYGTPIFGPHAALWSGSAASFLDLNPIQGGGSVIRGMAAGQQVGWASPAGSPSHAGFWTGTASSWVDLHPTPDGFSELYATDGHVQVGYLAAGAATFARAGLWFGTPGSFVDLSAYLPAGYPTSLATSVVESNGQIFVGGYARNSAGFDEAFMWVSVPAPASFALLATGALFAGRRPMRALQRCA